MTCPECGGPVHRADKGRRATYCSRTCQVRNLHRRQTSGGGGTIPLVLDFDTRHALDLAADRADVSTQRYVELLIDRHVEELLTAPEATGG